MKTTTRLMIASATLSLWLSGCGSGNGLGTAKDAAGKDVPGSSDASAGSPDSPSVPDSPSIPDQASVPDSPSNTDIAYAMDSPIAADGAGPVGVDGQVVDVGGSVVDGRGAEVGGGKVDGASTDAPSTLASGLVGWWRADGNAFDSAGSNNGTMQGGLAFVDGRIGQAFQFNGTDTTVTVKSSSSLAVSKGFTLAFWIRIHAIPSLQTVVLRKLVVGAEDKNVVLGPDGSIFFFFFPVMNGVPLLASTPLTVDTWHHVAVLYDGAQAKIYLDGSLGGSVAATGSIANSTGPLIFGQSLDFPYFAGALDEIRWYTRSLTESEIASLAAGGT